jgi:hypothetical protein
VSGNLNSWPLHMVPGSQAQLALGAGWRRSDIEDRLSDELGLQSRTESCLSLLLKQFDECSPSLETCRFSTTWFTPRIGFETIQLNQDPGGNGRGQAS